MTEPTAPKADPSALSFRLSFFKLVVRDIEAMIDFYARVFGFEQRNRVVLPGLDEAVLALPGDQFNLVLYYSTDGRDVTIGTGHGPVGFVTADVDAAYAHALAHGAEELRPPFSIQNMRVAFLRDPEGHEIELIQILQPSAAPTE